MEERDVKGVVAINAMGAALSEQSVAPCPVAVFVAPEPDRL